MASLSAQVMNLASRILVKRVLNKPTFNLQAVRRAMGARLTMPALLPRGLAVTASCDPVLRGEWQVPRDVHADGAILFLHGGGYIAGSPRTHRSCSGWLAQEAGTRLFSLDYRLAPEHPFPAALDDAVAAVEALVAAGTPASRIVLAGDSAGGGLALATLLRLRDAGQPLPAGAALICPLTDLTEASASLVTNAASEPLLGLRHRTQALRLYAGKTPLTDPLLSPVYADLRGLPPLLVQASRIEVLWDDARRLVERAQAAGVPVTFEPEDDVGHDWQLTVPLTPEARASVRSLGHWCAARLG